jgi:hypothetical protein
MFIKHNTVKVSDLRKNTIAVFKELDESDQVVTVFVNSEPKVVMMTPIHYNLLKAQKEKKVNWSAFNKFNNPPEHLLIKKKNVDAVKLIRELRD